MDALFNNEYTLGLISTAFVAFLAIRAWTHGVLKLFWAIIGLVLGSAAGFFFFQNANPLISRFLPGRELSENANTACSVVFAIVVYLIFRQISKSILQGIFGPDGFLSGWAEGFRGAALSLIPSCLTLLIIGLALRTGGTLMELRSAERICDPTKDYIEVQYPGWSPLVQLRDSFERLPYVSEIYQVIDPISRKPERRLVLLLITTKKDALFRHLQRHGAGGPVVTGPLFQSLMSDEAIRDLLKQRKHAALLRHPKIVRAAGNESLAYRLDGINLPTLIDEFMLSDSRQHTLENRQRADVPNF